MPENFSRDKKLNIYIDWASRKKNLAVVEDPERSIKYVVDLEFSTIGSFFLG